MEKKHCYIYWDDETVKDRKVYTQCEECYQKNKKGFRWGQMYGYIEIKCDLCNTIIYKKLKKKKKKKGEDEATI